MLTYGRELAELLDPIWEREALAYERPEKSEGLVVRKAMDLRCVAGAVAAR